MLKIQWKISGTTSSCMLPEHRRLNVAAAASARESEIDYF